jgi:hypothetical protein
MGPGRRKKAPQAIGLYRSGCINKIHLFAANAQCALMLKLSPGQAENVPHGHKLRVAGGPTPAPYPLIMDTAYQGDETLRLVCQLGYTPVVPPNPLRRTQWET